VLGYKGNDYGSKMDIAKHKLAIEIQKGKVKPFLYDANTDELKEISTGPDVYIGDDFTTMNIQYGIGAALEYSYPVVSLLKLKSIFPGGAVNSDSQTIQQKGGKAKSEKMYTPLYRYCESVFDEKQKLDHKLSIPKIADIIVQAMKTGAYKSSISKKDLDNMGDTILVKSTILKVLRAYKKSKK